MITRRIVLAGAAVLAFTASASAQDWKSRYPELTFAVVPAENASGVTERWTPFVVAVAGFCEASSTAAMIAASSSPPSARG